MVISISYIKNGMLHSPCEVSPSVFQLVFITTSYKGVVYFATFVLFGQTTGYFLTGRFYGTNVAPHATFIVNQKADINLQRA